MKKMLTIRLKSYVSLTIFVVSLSFMLTACQKEAQNFIPGTYTEEAKGYYSTLKVEVEVNEHYIVDIRIIDHEEPAILADIVFEQLPPKIKKRNSVDVDVISGATYTSKALLKSVGKALEAAQEVE